MDWAEVLILIGMFLIRVIVPAAILLAIGFLYEYLVEKHMPREGGSAMPQIDKETALPVITIRNTSAPQPEMYWAPACWEVMHCPAERRAACPAAQRQGVPCWVTMQLLTGQLPDRCLACPIFTETSHHADIQESTRIKE